MTDTVNKPICEICGQPMPEGEEMFKYHGYSGPCPKPPLSQPTPYAPCPYQHDSNSKCPDRASTPDDKASQDCGGSGIRHITLTDSNYGNEVLVRIDHITACTIISETTYRDGHIPDGVWRRTLIYTVGGNQIVVRETPEQIFAEMRKA